MYKFECIDFYDGIGCLLVCGFLPVRFHFVLAFVWGPGEEFVGVRGWFLFAIKGSGLEVADNQSKWRRCGERISDFETHKRKRSDCKGVNSLLFVFTVKSENY